VSFAYGCPEEIHSSNFRDVHHGVMGITFDRFYLIHNQETVRKERSMMTLLSSIFPSTVMNKGTSILLVPLVVYSHVEKTKD